MGDSLQDQLRALGLGGKQPDQRKDRKKAGKSARKQPAQAAPGQHAGEPSLDQAWALREQEEQRRAQQARNRRLEENRRRREINERVRAIVDAHRLNRDGAEVGRNFLFRGRIRKIYVTSEQQRALNADELGIVYLAGGYHLLTPEHLEAVRAISADHVVEQEGGAGDEDEFPVPDDLDW